MPLLTLITQQSLDEDYLHVAERRAARGAGARPGRAAHRTAAVVVAVFGVAGGHRRGPDRRATPTSTDAGRATLVAQIGDRPGRALRAPGPHGRSSGTATSALGAAAEPGRRAPRRRPPPGCAGSRRVHGLRPGDRRGRPDHRRRRAERRRRPSAVRDEDLAMLVDGLWAAGAEAIAINGHRLTALSAIRNVGVGDPRQQPAADPAVHRRGDRRHQDPAGRPARQRPGQRFCSLVEQLRLRLLDARTWTSSRCRRPRLTRLRRCRPGRDGPKTRHGRGDGP